MAAERQRVERRTVESRDPSLSDQANRALTHELREVTGSDAVEVPADRPRVAGDRHGDQPGIVVNLLAHRLTIALTFLVALVVGAIVSLATGSWWFLLLAAGVHAIGTFAITGLVLQMTSETEHLSPTAAALLEDEGVGDPDAVFSDLVEEFAEDEKGGRGERSKRGGLETLSNEHDERATPAHDDPAEAAVEQKSAMTPSQHGSRPVGP